MYNADGSPAEMCGNGIRCVGKYVYDRGIAVRELVNIETGDRVVPMKLEIVAGKVARARVNMGAPVLASREIPTTLAGDPPVRAGLDVAGRRLEVTCLSMGNPHCVTFLEELNDDWVLGVGPQIERHSAFPNRVNAEFVRVLSPEKIEMRVWERGSGETQACGSGACAAAVAGVLAGLTERRILACLPGGILEIEWTPSGDVWLTGEAVEVFCGEWPC
jgi:diaminopimelate epimerase